MPDSKIKYIALCQRNDGSLLVFAQACEKLSVKAWRRCVCVMRLYAGTMTIT